MMPSIDKEDYFKLYQERKKRAREFYANQSKNKGLKSIFQGGTFNFDYWLEELVK